MLFTKVLFLLCVESFDLFSNLASVLSVLVYWTSFCLPEKCQSISDMKFYFALLLYYGLMFLNLVGKLNACSLIWFVGWTQQEMQLGI